MENWMKKAYNEAQKGYDEGGIPIGALLVFNDQILGCGHNQRIQQGSVIRHGEMDALENAGRQPAKVYQQTTIYTTLSPCSMCAGTIALYGIPKVVIGENRSFSGEEDWLKSKGVEVVVLDDPECIALMQQFMREKPELWNEDIGKE